ncbi:MAG: nucleotidyltransferase family protein, partial [Erysipelotrichaceae bacterium]|nr:nucleotidyltransferase family protein [Erysipelotrichaceae bacterium]
GLELKEIASARAIREAIRKGKDVSRQTPIKIDGPVFTDDLYPYLQRPLLTMSKDDLKEIFLVSEGIESLLVKNAAEYDDYQSFLDASISKRYTKARISRICLNIMNHIKKEDVRNGDRLTYVRVLGFNHKGQEYLRSLRDEGFRIVTQFKNIPACQKNIEWKAANLYATLLKDRKAYLKEELKGPIITD